MQTDPQDRRDFFSFRAEAFLPRAESPSEYKARRIKHKGWEVQRKKYLTLKEDFKLPFYTCFSLGNPKFIQQKSMCNLYDKIRQKQKSRFSFIDVIS